MREPSCLVALCALLSSTTVGCNTCDNEEPCERADYAAKPPGLMRGIGGVAYYQSDVIENGCKDCRFENYSFEYWQFDSDPQEPDVVTETLSSDVLPDQVLEVRGEYAYELDSGFYLLCTRTTPRSCVVFEVSQGTVWTVHLQGGYASPSPQLKVFGPDQQLQPDLPFLFPAP